MAAAYVVDGRSAFFAPKESRTACSNPSQQLTDSTGRPPPPPPLHHTPLDSSTTGLNNLSSTPPPLLSVSLTHQTDHVEEIIQYAQEGRVEAKRRGEKEAGRMSRESSAAETAEMEGIFKRLDTNGDGKISSVELGKALSTLGDVTAEDVHRMMREIDTDGDGCIDFGEFAAFYRANRGLMKDFAKVF